MARTSRDDVAALLTPRVATGEGGLIAVDTAGNVLVTGSYMGTVDFGGGPLDVHRDPADRVERDDEVRLVALRHREDHVGVADHARMDDVHRDGRPQIYLRDEDYTSHTLTFALRSGRSLRAALMRLSGL